MNARIVAMMTGLMFDVGTEMTQIAAAHVGAGKAHEQINIGEAVDEAANAIAVAGIACGEKGDRAGMRVALVKAAAWALLAAHQIDDEAAKAKGEAAHG